jgi:hypothetical protein
MKTHEMETRNETAAASNGAPSLDAGDLALLRSWNIPPTAPEALELVLIGRLQRRLRVPADGIFGASVTKALMRSRLETMLDAQTMGVVRTASARSGKSIVAVYRARMRREQAERSEITPVMLRVLQWADDNDDGDTALDMELYGPAVAKCVELGLIELKGVLTDAEMRLTDAGYYVRDRALKSDQ